MRSRRRSIAPADHNYPNHRLDYSVEDTHLAFTVGGSFKHKAKAAKSVGSERKVTMKTMYLAAAAALLMIGGAAQAEPVGSGHLSNEPQEAAALARTIHRPLRASNQLSIENPTGLPSYEMRPDGLMINGLLPAPGWQG
jgi:hypothetical protein